MSKVNACISIENAFLLPGSFRNFSGREGKFNAAGVRSCCVKLEPEFAAKLKKDGWNVRKLEARDPDSDDLYYIQVSVSYKNIPPKIYMINSSGKVLLDESTVGLLDSADIENVDMIIRPYNWEVNGKSGVKAYVKSMYVTIAEDEFAAKYRDVPDDSDEEELPFL